MVGQGACRDCSARPANSASWQVARIASTELAFSESEDAFNSLSPEVTSARADREVRLGEPAVVLAEVVADCDAELIVVGSRGRGAMALGCAGLGIDGGHAACALSGDDRA